MFPPHLGSPLYGRVPALGAHVEQRVSLVGDTGRHRRPREASALWLFGKTFLALVVVFGIVAALGLAYRDPIERAGRWFIDAFGYAGMGFGTFLADGLHFPIPPQFYMLAVVIDQRPVLPALGAITVGSLVGGHVAYFLASKVRSIPFFRRGARRAEKTMHNLIERFGTWALVIGSLTPIPYSFLCYLSGLNRLPYKKFVLLCALRVPKIALYYALVALGWSM